MSNRLITYLVCLTSFLVGGLTLSDTASADGAPSQAEIVQVLERGVRLSPVRGAVTGPLVVVVDEAGNTVTPDLASPQFSAGLGWYIYLYFTRGEWSWLQGLSYAALSAAVCAWLTPTIGGAIACGVVAYIIYSIVDDYGIPPVGYCKEVKISYAGSLKGVKNVKRSC